MCVHVKYVNGCWIISKLKAMGHMTLAVHPQHVEINFAPAGFLSFARRIVWFDKDCEIKPCVVNGYERKTKPHIIQQPSRNWTASIRMCFVLDPFLFMEGQTTFAPCLRVFMLGSLCWNWHVSSPVHLCCTEGEKWMCLSGEKSPLYPVSVPITATCHPTNGFLILLHFEDISTWQRMSWIHCENGSSCSLFTRLASELSFIKMSIAPKVTSDTDNSKFRRII